MSSEKKIAVVIPTYNREKLLSYTLDSLVRQTLPAKSFEVIVVDDGGSDHSKEVTLSYDSHLDIAYLRQKDMGFRAGRARNMGIAHAESPYVLFLDTGILLSPEGLENHLTIHENSHHACSVIGNIYAFDTPNELVEKILPYADSTDVRTCIEAAKKFEAYDFRQYQYRVLGNDLHCWAAPFDVFWSGHLSVDKREVIKAGGFDAETSRWGGEDVDLGIKLFLRNNIFYTDNTITSFHWPHPKAVSDIKEETYQCGLALHERYNLWQTAFYRFLGSPKRHPLFSLNMAIHFTGPGYDEKQLEAFSLKNREKFEKGDTVLSELEDFA